MNNFENDFSFIGEIPEAAASGEGVVLTEEQKKAFLESQKEARKRIAQRNKIAQKNIHKMSLKENDGYAFGSMVRNGILAIALCFGGMALGGLGIPLIIASLYFACKALKVIVWDYFLNKVFAPFRYIYRCLTKTTDNSGNVYYDDVYRRHIKYQSTSSLVIFGIGGSILFYLLVFACFSALFFYRPYEDGLRLHHASYENQEILYSPEFFEKELWEHAYAISTNPDDGMVTIRLSNGEEIEKYKWFVKGEYVEKPESFKDTSFLVLKTSASWIGDSVKGLYRKISSISFQK